jgi:hypothetical protein
MRPTAMNQLTTIEFVMGKPNGLAISTGFCDGPRSSVSGVAVVVLAGAAALVDVVEALFKSAFTANAHAAPSERNRAIRSSNINLAFTLDKI